MSKEAVNLAIEQLLPQINENIDKLLNSKLVNVKENLSNELYGKIWDRAMIEIGKQLNLPTEIITSLQNVDNLVKDNETKITDGLEKLHAKYLEFENRVKGIDLNETVTMTYGALQTIKIKSASAWGTVCFIAGFLAGVVFG